MASAGLCLTALSHRSVCFQSETNTSGLLVVWFRRPENSAVFDWLPVESNRSLVEFTEEEEEDGLIETDETLHL